MPDSLLFPHKYPLAATAQYFHSKASFFLKSVDTAEQLRVIHFKWLNQLLSMKLRTFENLERGKIVEAFVAWKSQWRQRVEYRVQIEQTERVHILGEGYIIFKMTVSNWAQLSWDRRICGWFVIRRLRPTSTPKFSPIGAVLGLQFLPFSHFLTFSL